MKNIRTIIMMDQRRLLKNSIALVIAVGLVILPSMYAWFNIAANWDPYSNTNRLTVAVASEDEGYTGEIIPININIGDQVETRLRSNDSMGWEFTTKDDAIDGVKSGKYYAALVVPESFSRDMLSIFSDEVQPASITYYVNEKENAIASLITSKGASAVQKQVDEAFTKTVAQVTLDAMNTVSKYYDQLDADQLSANLAQQLTSLQGSVQNASASIDACKNLNSSLQLLLESTSDILSETESRTVSSADTIDSAASSSASLKEDLLSVSQSVDTALGQTADSYTAMENQITRGLQQLNTNAKQGSSSLQTLSGRMQTLTGRLTSVRDDLERLGDSVGGADTGLGVSIQKMAAQLDGVIERQTETRSLLDDAANGLTDASSDALAAQDTLTASIRESARAMESIQSDYRDDVEPSLEELASSLQSTRDSAQSVVDRLQKGTEGVQKIAGDTSGSLGTMNESLEATKALLDDAAARIDEAQTLLTTGEGDSAQIIQNLLGYDSDTVSSFLSSIVQLDSHAVYPVENYGSAMAPFYSTLAIWVGALIMTTMIKTGTSEGLRRRLKNLKPHEEYFGRYALFQIIGLLQTTIICLGDLFYLGIQCEHPVLFMLAGYVSCIVYVNLMYTMALSFGDVGKAICVIIMVIQVAGSGGTFPIEMTTPFFQKLYPFLPFVHSMTAMREAIAGMYGMDYWKALGYMGCFLLASLFVGLVLRRYTTRLHNFFEEQVESTKLIG